MSTVVKKRDAMPRPHVMVKELSIALLVTGNLIGAGILGIPVIAGLCGAGPATLVMGVFCLAMYCSACIIADETIARRSHTFNYPSLYQHYLGRTGKWIAAVANMLILYGLLTAYLAGGSTILAQIFGLQTTLVVHLFLFFALTLLTVAGMTIIRRCNAGLITLLWLSFFVIVALGSQRMQVHHFQHVYWPFLPVTIPVIVTAFHFHNIIPNIAEALDYDRMSIRRAMRMGMCIGFLMNMVWLLVGIGVVPLQGTSDSLTHCYLHNIPATIPMANIIDSSSFMVFAMLFSIIAIVTSYVANGLGLMGFSGDLLNNYLRIKSRAVIIAVTFLPPLAISLTHPEIFLKAINVVGGYGIVVLFGILPAVILLIRPAASPRLRLWALVLLLLFSAVLLLQIGMDTRLLSIQPPL